MQVVVVLFNLLVILEFCPFESLPRQVRVIRVHTIGFPTLGLNQKKLAMVISFQWCLLLLFVYIITMFFAIEQNYKTS